MPPHLVPTPCLYTLSPRFVGYASSPHFVPALCRNQRGKLTRRRKNLKCKRGTLLTPLTLLTRLTVAHAQHHPVNRVNEVNEVNAVQKPARQTKRRQECPRHIGTAIIGTCRSRRHLSPPVDYSGNPFASDAPWSPRSPRYIGERMRRRTYRRGRRAPAFRLSVHL